MQIISKPIDGEELTLGCLVAMNVNKAWGSAAVEIWNKKESIKKHPELLELVDDVVEYKNDNQFIKLFNVSSKETPTLPVVKMADILSSRVVAFKFISFWNEHRWAAGSDFELEIINTNPACEEKVSEYTRKKIVTKSNFNKELFVEEVIASDLSKSWADRFVKHWNDKNWTEHSEIYLEVVEMDYAPYDGYAENGYY